MRRRKSALIKSNNPHLAGGEKRFRKFARNPFARNDGHQCQKLRRNCDFGGQRATLSHVCVKAFVCKSLCLYLCLCVSVCVCFSLLSVSVGLSNFVSIFVCFCLESGIAFLSPFC